MSDFNVMLRIKSITMLTTLANAVGQYDGEVHIIDMSGVSLDAKSVFNLFVLNLSAPVQLYGRGSAKSNSRLLESIRQCLAPDDTPFLIKAQDLTFKEVK